MSLTSTQTHYTQYGVLWSLDVPTNTLKEGGAETGVLPALPMISQLKGDFSPRTDRMT